MQKRQLIVAFWFALTFSLLCVVLSLLHHGLAHHYPMIGLLVWRTMYPSFLVKQAIEAYAHIAIGGQHEMFLIFLIQFLVAFAGYLLVVTVLGKKQHA